MFSGKCFTLFPLDISSSLQVTLVTNEHDDHVTVAVLPGVLQPGSQVVEGVPPGDVVHQQGSSCSSVVRPSYGSKCFLSSCVPNL